MLTTELVHEGILQIGKTIKSISIAHIQMHLKKILMHIGILTENTIFFLHLVFRTFIGSIVFSIKNRGHFAQFVAAAAANLDCGEFTLLHKIPYRCRLDTEFSTNFGFGKKSVFFRLHK